MRQQLQVFELRLREKIGLRRIGREPEPSNEMVEIKSVESFDREGVDSGHLAPVYLLNALSLARKLPLNARVLDLGSGSGRFISLLARLRTDLWITGVDLSDGMISLANRNFELEGLFPRVRIAKMDMIQAVSHFSDHDAITSIFSLHHLPSLESVRDLFKNISIFSAIKNKPIWIFDFHRPNREYSCRLFPQIFTPEGSPEFIIDTVNSMKAAFTFEEIISVVEADFRAKMDHHISTPIKFYQTFSNLRDFPSLDIKIPRLLSPDIYEIARLFLSCFNLPHLNQID